MTGPPMPVNGTGPYAIAQGVHHCVENQLEK